jgi:hypothetical protein
MREQGVRSVLWRDLAQAPPRDLWDLIPVSIAWFVAFGVGRWCVFAAGRARRADPKATEHGWRAILYLVPTGRLGMTLLLRAPHEASHWLRRPATMWAMWATTRPSAAVTDAYQLYTGLYVHELLCVAAFDAPFRERWLFLLHHGVTLLLLGTSWYLRFERCGAAIMVVHDLSDVLLCAAKYCKRTGAHARAEVLFALFAVSFFALRLGILPTILASVLRDAPSALFPGHTPGYAMTTPVVLLFFPLLATLQLMHVWWGWRIASVAYRQIIYGVLAADDD